jgi:hypothetical protein
MLIHQVGILRWLAYSPDRVTNGGYFNPLLSQFKAVCFFHNSDEITQDNVYYRVDSSLNPFLGLQFGLMF